MLVIFGWMRRFTLLGIKLDACTNCGNVCEHAVGRKTNWGHVFWIPVLFLGWEHGMFCAICQTWTGIGWRQVRAAMKTGVLHLDRPRPVEPTMLAAGAPGVGEPPLPPALVFDQLVVNRKRGAWDFYTKAWPAIVVGVLALGMLGQAFKGTSGALAGTGLPVSDPVMATYAPDAHRCWEAPDGSINGCRLSDGTLVGEATGPEITCYFADGQIYTAESFRCD